MRARMALKIAQIDYEHREILLKNKPQQMLDISPKGTVPVLQLADGTVLEESLDIMHWALVQNDPQGLLQFSKIEFAEIEALIATNDKEFKHALNRYKYPERYAETSGEKWCHAGEGFLRLLEKFLQQHRFLFAEKPSLADIAIFPFVRQFAHVDFDWFIVQPYPRLLQWYRYWIDSELFASVMEKHPLFECD